MSDEQKIIEAFDRVWRNPSADNLAVLLHERTTLFQPHLPPIHGRHHAKQEFIRFLDWMPSFFGEVRHAAFNESVIFIEWQMNFSFNNVTFPIQAVDRIIIEDGLILERHVVFNTLSIIKKVFTLPAEWPAYYRYRYRGQR